MSMKQTPAGIEVGGQCKCDIPAMSNDPAVTACLLCHKPLQESTNTVRIATIRIQTVLDELFQPKPNEPIGESTLGRMQALASVISVS